MNFRSARSSLLISALTATTIAASACHRQPVGTRPEMRRVDTLWYATSRARVKERLGYRLADSLEFGYYLVSSRAGADVMRSRLGLRIIDSTQLTQSAFLRAIAARAIAAAPTDTGDATVVSVHGYATNHSKAIRDAAESYIRSGTRARWVAFSWPSNGRGMLLMQPGRFFIANAYRGDSIAAVRSKPAFAELLHAMHAAIGGRHLVVVTHSLGAQLAAEVLVSDTAVRASLARDPIRAIGLFEPDVASRRFADSTLAGLRSAARRIALYASTNDGMLRFSRLVNGTRRAGLLDNTSRAIDGIEIVDVTDGETSEDWFRRRFGTHHAMKKESGALRDFFEVVVAGESPSCRLTRKSADMRPDGIWKLLPAGVRQTAC